MAQDSEVRKASNLKDNLDEKEREKLINYLMIRLKDFNYKEVIDKDNYKFFSEEYLKFQGIKPEFGFIECNIELNETFLLYGKFAAITSALGGLSCFYFLFSNNMGLGEEEEKEEE